MIPRAVAPKDFMPAKEARSLSDQYDERRRDPYLTDLDRAREQVTEAAEAGFRECGLTVSGHVANMLAADISLLGYRVRVYSGYSSPTTIQISWKDQEHGNP